MMDSSLSNETKRHCFPLIDGEEFLSFFGMIIRLGLCRSHEKKHMKENFKTVKADHNQRMSPGFQMGMHRWEAILDALKPNVAEFITLSEFQNKARLIQDRSYRLMMESYHLT